MTPRMLRQSMADLRVSNRSPAMRTSNRSPQDASLRTSFDMASSSERQSARELADQKFGSGSRSDSNILQRAGSMDRGPEPSFQLRPPPQAPPISNESEDLALAERPVDQLNETSDGRDPSPDPSSLQQQRKSKRFRERRLSKDLQEVLDEDEDAPPRPPSLQINDGEDAGVNGGGDPSFKGSEGSIKSNEGEASFMGMNGQPLSPAKQASRLDVSKSGLPVDKGHHGGRKSITISSEIEELEEDAATPFDRSLVGTYSCHGAEPTDTGSTAKINQDCACLMHPFARTPGTALFCVYDGHGKFGHHVSQEVLHSLLYELEENNERLQEDPAALLAETFENVNVHLRLCGQEQPCVVDAADSGACAIVVWMRGRELVVAGAGDCRAVLGTRHGEQLLSVALSTDHKADLPAEQARIEAAGGWVRPESGDADDFNPARLYEVKGKPWLGPGLCVARHGQSASLSSAPARLLRLLRAPGGSGPLGTPRVVAGRWDPSHGLKSSS